MSASQLKRVVSACQSGSWLGVKWGNCHMGVVLMDGMGSLKTGWAFSLRRILRFSGCLYVCCIGR